ncbi:MAG: DUF421 domain-containing protein, partial [Clostridia bacterium]|nr:DUF421 domain-containing protein [Clostridia bacterium]
QIGELDVGDLVSTLLISELAAIPIDDSNIPLLNAVLPILFIVSLEIIISALKNKHSIFKRYAEGIPSFIIYKGNLHQKTLKENRISINEMLTEARVQGIFDIKDIDYCILEANGKVSISKKQNATGSVAHPLIIDGEINKNELELMKMSENEVLAQVENKDIKSVFLLTVDDNFTYNIIIKEEI